VSFGVPRQLFRKYDIYNVIEGLKKRLKDDYETLPDDRALDETIVKQLKAKHSLEIPRLKPEEMEYEENTTRVDARRLPGRLVAGSGGPVWVDASELMFHIPFEGDPGIFDVAPSAFNGTSAIGAIMEQELLLTVVVAQADFDTKGHINREISNINWRLDSLRGSLAHMDNQLEHQLRVCMDVRKRSIGARKSVSIKLDIPKRVPAQALAPPAEPAPAVSQPKSSPKAKENRQWDVFVSHASPDKPYVEPLVKALNDAGVSVWYDKEVLEWGDRLRPKINEGLIKSHYAIVVLSMAYLAKRKWTEHELDSLFAREELGQVIILPIWHGVVRKDLLEYDPSLADRLAKISETDSHEDIVRSVLHRLGRVTDSSSDATDSDGAVVWPGGKKSNALVNASYDKPGTSEKVQLYIRQSPITKAWFVLEEVPDREHHGTRADISGRFAACDRYLRNDGFKRMSYGNASGDSAFDL
jgi:hypothetical protein